MGHAADRRLWLARLVVDGGAAAVEAVPHAARRGGAALGRARRRGAPLHRRAVAGGAAVVDADDGAHRAGTPGRHAGAAGGAAAAGRPGRPVAGWARPGRDRPPPRASGSRTDHVRLHRLPRFVTSFEAGGECSIRQARVGEAKGPGGKRGPYAVLGPTGLRAARWPPPLALGIQGCGRPPPWSSARGCRQTPSLRRPRSVDYRRGLLPKSTKPTPGEAKYLVGSLEERCRAKVCRSPAEATQRRAGHSRRAQARRAEHGLAGPSSHQVLRFAPTALPILHGAREVMNRWRGRLTELRVEVAGDAGAIGRG